MKGRRLFLLVSMLVWLAIVAFIVIASMDRLSVPPWGNPSGDGRTEQIAGPLQVGQQFTAPYPGLYRIEVTLDPGAVTTAQPITLQLRAGPSASQVLAVAEFSTGDVREEKPQSLEFAPIQGSEGRTFFLSLESPDSAPGNAVTAHYDPDSILSGATAYSNGQSIDGNLKFRTFYSLRTREKLWLLLDRMAEDRPYLFGTRGFYVGLAVTYVIVLGIFLWQIAQAILEDEGT